MSEKRYTREELMDAARMLGLDQTYTPHTFEEYWTMLRQLLDENAKLKAQAEQAIAQERALKEKWFGEAKKLRDDNAKLRDDLEKAEDNYSGCKIDLKHFESKLLDIRSRFAALAAAGRGSNPPAGAESTAVHFNCTCGRFWQIKSDGAFEEVPTIRAEPAPYVPVSELRKLRTVARGFSDAFVRWDEIEALIAKCETELRAGTPE